MSIKELDVVDSDKTYITIKRNTFYFLSICTILFFGSSVVGYFAYVSASNPLIFCDYVITHNFGDQDAQDGCNYKLAKELNAIEYCNGIKNPDLQKECVKVVNEKLIQ